MLNADAAIGQLGNIQGHNMFSYCFNNPIMMSDPSGCWPKWNDIGNFISGVAKAVTDTIVTVASAVGNAVGGLPSLVSGIFGGVQSVNKLQEDYNNQDVKEKNHTTNVLNYDPKKDSFVEKLKPIGNVNVDSDLYKQYCKTAKSYLSEIHLNDYIPGCPPNMSADKYAADFSEEDIKNLAGNIMYWDSWGYANIILSTAKDLAKTGIEAVYP